MNITSEDEALLELFENGKTSDKKYKRLPIAAIKGYVKAVNKMRAATRIEDIKYGRNGIDDASAS